MIWNFHILDTDFNNSCRKPHKRRPDVAYWRKGCVVPDHYVFLSVDDFRLIITDDMNAFETYIYVNNQDKLKFLFVTPERLKRDRKYKGRNKKGQFGFYKVFDASDYIATKIEWHMEK